MHAGHQEVSSVAPLFNLRNPLRAGDEARNRGVIDVLQNVVKRQCSQNLHLNPTYAVGTFPSHTTGKAFTSDWFGNSFVMVVYDNFFLIHS